MASGHRGPLPVRFSSVRSAVKENNLLRSSGPKTLLSCKDQDSGGLASPSYERSRANMKFKKLFSRDADVSGLIKKSRKTKKGFYSLCFVT